MDVNYDLTSEKVAQAYGLTCQSMAPNPGVVVSYDE
jgi:hypothetical protein